MPKNRHSGWLFFRFFGLFWRRQEKATHPRQAEDGCTPVPKKPRCQRKTRSLSEAQRAGCTSTGCSVEEGHSAEATKGLGWTPGVLLVSGCLDRPGLAREARRKTFSLRSVGFRDAWLVPSRRFPSRTHGVPDRTAGCAYLVSSPSPSWSCGETCMASLLGLKIR